MIIFKFYKFILILSIFIFLLFSCSDKNKLLSKATEYHNKSIVIYDSLKLKSVELDEIARKLNFIKDNLRGKDTVDKVKLLGLVSDIENAKIDLNNWEEYIGASSNIEVTEGQIIKIKKGFREIIKIKSEMHEIKMRSIKLINHSTSSK